MYVDAHSKSTQALPVRIFTYSVKFIFQWHCVEVLGISPAGLHYALCLQLGLLVCWRSYLVTISPSAMMPMNMIVYS